MAVRRKTDNDDVPSYTFEREDADNRRVYYRGLDGWLYCLHDVGQHGFPQVRFCRCTDAGEPVLTLSMPFPADFDRYVSPVPVEEISEQSV